MRKDAGYPPLVTPSSQIVGTQAVFNVLMGPYKVLTGEFADLMLGYYGETIGERDPAIVEASRARHAKKADHRAPGRPDLKPEWDDCVAEASALEGCDGTDEDVLTYAMFPQVAPKFFVDAARGTQERRQGPGRGRASRRAGQVDRRQGPITGPVPYAGPDLGETSHTVTVEPA